MPAKERYLELLHKEHPNYTPFQMNNNEQPTPAWESIETAPKDGSRVLAWRASWDEPRFVRWCENTRTKTTFWNDHVEMDHYQNETEPPTHWRRLEPIPKPGDAL